MRTILTIKEQREFFEKHPEARTWVHKWSIRGMGSSRILNGAGDVIGRAGGCGYDRYGTALGKAMEYYFSEEILKLAKRECRGPRRDYKGSENFYGLFYDPTQKKAWVSGGCGSESMKRILQKIGFSLDYVGESSRSTNGETFYTLTPLTAQDRKYFRG